MFTEIKTSLYSKPAPTLRLIVDFAAMASGPLPFAPEDIELIHRGLDKGVRSETLIAAAATAIPNIIWGKSERP